MSFMAQSNLAADAMREGDLDEAEFRLQRAAESEPFMEMTIEVQKVQLHKARQAQKSMPLTMPSTSPS